MNKGLTLTALTKKQSDRSISKNHVDEQIRLIDAQIRLNHANNMDRIKYELPTTFNINAMTKADAQLLVWSELVAIYKNDKGFERTFIDVSIPSKPYLIIEWTGGMNEDERIRRKALLDSVKLQ